MDSASTNGIVETYISALINGDYDAVAFADDVQFLGPLHERPLNGKSVVLEFLRQVSTWVSDIRINERFIDGGRVCLIIDFEAKDGTVVPMADHISVKDGKIVSIRPYYDPRPLLEMERG